MTAPSSPHSNGEMAGLAQALAGQYDLECEIGRGGMGVVYRARDLRLDRLVAIKTLPRHIADDPSVRERFIREARTAARLSHPNIVPIHRADEIDGHVFFVMGLVDGESLAQRIAAHGSLQPADAIPILRDVASALDYAHEHQVIHRDVKAENILIDGKTGRAMVTDFGIARVAEAPALTATGQVLGSVHYLSPEQVSGESVDARSDIYSLGVVGFFALSGRFPFNSSLASAVLVSHITKLAPELHTVAPSVPRDLATIIDRCLSKDPRSRFQRCADVDAALAAIRVTPRDVSRPTPLISDTEGHRILERAADLQMYTSQSPLPALTPVERDAARDLARTSGYKPMELREAALEAGIPTAAIDRAMQERGLGATRPAGAILDESPEPNVLLGAATRVEFETIVDGEMPSEDFDLLVEIMRRATGEPGRLDTVGRSFSWQSHEGKGGGMSVSVLARAGKTRIRVSESMKAAAGGFFGGIGGGLGGGSIGVWAGIGASLHQPIAGLVGWLGTIVVAYSGARIGLGFYARSTERKARQVIEQLAAQARESIESRGGH